MNSTSTEPTYSTSHDSTSQLLLALVIVELFLGTTVMVLRTYTKFRLTKDSEKWSYVWAVLTWIAGVFNFAAVTLSVSHGLGQRSYVLSEQDVIDSTKWSFVSDGTSRIGIACGRIAIVAFIYGIQGKTAARWRKVFLWIIGVSNLLFNVTAIFLLFFRCNPPESSWDKGTPRGSCPLDKVNSRFAYVALGWGALSDLVLACYPITVVSRLNMPTRTKVTLSVIMSMSLLSFVCAIMTVYELVRVTTLATSSHSSPSPTPSDPTWLLTPVTIWASTELWVVLIAPSIPPLWPLLKKLSCSHQHRSLPSQDATVSKGSDLSRSLSGHKANSQLRITVVRDFEVSTIDRPHNSQHHDSNEKHATEETKWSNGTIPV